MLYMYRLVISVNLFTIIIVRNTNGYEVENCTQEAKTKTPKIMCSMQQVGWVVIYERSRLGYLQITEKQLK